MSLPPPSTGLDEVAKRLEREALDNGHDIGEGFEAATVMEDTMPIPGQLRLECHRCHEVAYVAPWGEVNPMNPGRCRGRTVAPDLGRDDGRS